MAIAQRRRPGPAAGWPRGLGGSRPRIASTLLGLMALLALGAAGMVWVGYPPVVAFGYVLCVMLAGRATDVWPAAR